MAILIKDRSVLKHRGYYTVHVGSDRYGEIIGSIRKVPGHNSWWAVRTKNPYTKQMEADLSLPTFAEAKKYALDLAAIYES